MSHARTAVFRRLPRRLRKPAELAELVWTTGILRSPVELARRLRHRGQLAHLGRAFFGFRYATAILLAHEIGLWRVLGDGPGDVGSISRATEVHPRSAEALLRILEAEGAVERAGERWSLTAFGNHFLSPAGVHTMSGTLDLMAAQAASFGEIVAGMRTGRTPRALDIFEPGSRYGAFLDAVNDYLLVATRDLLHRVALPDVRDLIVGSMGVSFSAVVLERFPDARVTYGCLEHLAREIPRLRHQYEVPPDRVVETHAHGGDPTADTWGSEAFDLVFLTKKMILAPEERTGEKFARKAFDVLNPGGALILWESLHTDGRPTPLVRAMEAVLDLGASPQGLVNTEEGIVALLEGIGFAEVEIVPCLAGQLTFVVARTPGGSPG